MFPILNKVCYFVNIKRHAPGTHTKKVDNIILQMYKFPQSLMTVAITIMAFCLANLAPHFAEKDERAQKIRERAVYISYFWGMGFAIVLMIIFYPTSPIASCISCINTIYRIIYFSCFFKYGLLCKEILRNAEFRGKPVLDFCLADWIVTYYD